MGSALSNLALRQSIVPQMLKLSWWLSRGVVAMASAGHLPTRRSLAAIAKLCGWVLSRRWPFMRREVTGNLNLGFDDLLELQFLRCRNFRVLIVGAFDGVTNDPTSEFITKHPCHAIFVEPQPAAFSRLRERFGGRSNVDLHNAAIDAATGHRVIYCVPPGVAGLPLWTEQLASFDKLHLLKHEDRAPGISQHIVAVQVPTLTFTDLLRKSDVGSVDVLQIDAEGFDAQLLAWFPFESIKPGLLHYETAHMSEDEHSAATARLRDLGYLVMNSDSPTDDMAFRF